MPSPFPGIDPYLEDPAFWSDFHVRFINYWCEMVAERLPDHYEARIDERVNLVDVSAGKIKRFEPDVAVSHGNGSSAPSPGLGGVATLEPVTVPLRIEEETRETYIEILHRPERSLVGVLELLSPSNKEEPGRTLYLAKRNALLHQAIHLVELDFLRKGQRVPLDGDYPAGDYYALVARWDRRPDCHVYGWTLRQPLPTIPIPLRPPDADLFIDLAAVFAITYEKGRYARSLDYSRPPPISLGTEDVHWVTALLRSSAQS